MAIQGLGRSAGESPPGRIVEDRDGAIWLAGKQGLFVVRGERAERCWSGVVLAVAASPGGGVDFLTENIIGRVRNGSLSTLLRLPAGMASSGGPALAETAVGIWFGTRNHGLGLFHKGTIETFGRRDGLSSDGIVSIKVDREGDVWVGTTLGLHRFREPMAHLMSQEDGLPRGMPSIIFRDHAEGLWFGTTLELRRIDSKSGETRSWQGNFHSIGEDGSTVWLGTLNQIGYLDGGRLVLVVGDDGKPIGTVSAFLHDDNGLFWALSRSALYRIEGRRPRRIVQGSFHSRFVVSNTSGTWIALANEGLLHIDHDRKTVVGSGSGIAGGTVLAITEDGGSLWIGTAITPRQVTFPWTLRCRYGWTTKVRFDTCGANWVEPNTMSTIFCIRRCPKISRLSSLSP